MVLLTNPGVLGELTPGDAQNLLMLVRGEIPPIQGDDARLATGVRDLSGLGNNQADPTRASLNTPFVRLTDARYGVLDQATNKARINPIFKGIDARAVSNAIGTQAADTPPGDVASNLFMAFSQYLDHGLTFIKKGGNGLGNDKIAIGQTFTPGGPNDPADLTRAQIAGWDNGQPQFLNHDTPYVDQNQAYGPIKAVGQLLRCSDGNGGFASKMYCSTKPDPSAPGFYLLPNLRELLDHHIAQATVFSTSQGEMTLLEYYPALVDVQGNYNPVVVQDLVGNFVGCGYNLLIDSNPAINLLDHIISGDGRVNENVSLTAMHAVWVRNHNHHADQLAQLYTDAGVALSQEELFQAAKIVNEAEYQRVIFTEFAEKLLGGKGILGDGNHGFRDYKPDADASISLEFQAIAFRIGHTMIPDDLWILGADGQITPTPLFHLFLNPTNDLKALSVDHDRNPATAPLSGDAALAVMARMGYTPTPGFNELGTGAIIGGIVEQPAEAVDGQMVDAVRNDLVRVRADLFSQNVARGWDEGLGTLNQIRHGLLASTSSYVQEAISYVGAANLQPYSDWNDFQTRNGLSNTVINQFRQAYPDLVLTDSLAIGEFKRLNPGVGSEVNGTFVVKGIDRVDAWVGGLCEAKVDIGAQGKPAVVGSTFWVILHEQLDRLQEADRHYYIPRLENLDLYANFVEGITFSEIVTRNTGLANLPESIFDVFNPNAPGPTFGTLLAPNPVTPPAEPVVTAPVVAEPVVTTPSPVVTTPDPVVIAPDPVAPAVDIPPVQEPTVQAPAVDAALKLGLHLVKDPVFGGDLRKDIVLREWGNDKEQGSKFYLALTAQSLYGSAINTLDFTINLGKDFEQAFKLNSDNIHFTNDLAEARRVQVLDGEDGPSVRFEGAGLDHLGSGKEIDDTTVLAYIQLEQLDNIESQIEAIRKTNRQTGVYTETFNVAQHFSTSVNVDEIIFEDLVSLRDLGGTAAVVSSDLEVNVRAAQAGLTTESRFDLGTSREITKEGEGRYTNLIRRHDTIFQESIWRNTGEFTLTDLHITDIGNGENAVAKVTSHFDNLQGSKDGGELGWIGSGDAEEATIVSKFKITGAAGSVLDTTQLGYKLEANGGYSWDTTEMTRFAVKHLITYQGDLNYDGRVSMADLAFLNKGAEEFNKDGTIAHDVNANFEGGIDMDDLDVIDADWGKNLHLGDGKFMGQGTGQGAISSMEELMMQGGHAWDSSAFLKQSAIQAGNGGAMNQGYVNVITDSQATFTGTSIGGVDDLERLLTEQYATHV